MKRSLRLILESFEDRTTPATFGIPWSDPTHLTISFVPDGTDVAGTSSNLFQTLNALSPTSNWQSDILRAAQTWSSVANVNIGLTSDNGAALGSVPPLTGYPGFGTIRVAAKPLANNVLAVGIPPNELGASSWAGDVIFNSNANLATQKTDLYTVFLHEIGHALGLPGSGDPRSVMYQRIVGKRTGLALSDVISVVSLYGVRLPDLNEVPGKGNDTIKAATRLDYEDSGPEAWTGTTPLIGFGDITRMSDVDVFSYKNLPDYSGPISFRLLTQGISLLNPKITVLDGNGKTLKSVSTLSVGGSDLTVQLDNSVSGGKYYVRIETANIANPFNAGRYGLEVSLNNRITVNADTITKVLRGPYEALSTQDIDALFQENADNALLNQDDFSDDTAKSASQIKSNNSLTTAFSVVGSLQDLADVDFYRVRVPKLTTSNSANLTLTLAPYRINGVMPDVQLFDKNQNLVPINVLSNGNGAMVIQALNLVSNNDYFIRIANPPGQSNVGNYQANLRFGKTATTLQTFFSGSVQGTGASSTVYVAEPQLFHLLLSSNNGVAVTMTIENLSGATIYTLTSNGMPASSTPLLLQPGEYRIRVTTTGLNTVVSLRGDSISDPVGSAVVDPNKTPQYPTPGNPGTNTYPNGTVTTKPYLWLSLTL